MIKREEEVQEVKDLVSKGSTGFLQGFYAINLVNNFVGEVRPDMNDEFKGFYRSYLKGLYDASYGIKSSLGNRGTSEVLLEHIFPEFIDGTFDSRDITIEQREACKKLISGSEAYQECSDELKAVILESISYVPERRVVDYKEVDYNIPAGTGRVFTFKQEDRER